MRERTIKVFNCDHCNKLYQRNTACESHETICYKNPENYRPCLSCPHLEKVDTGGVTFDHNGYDHERAVKVFKCSHFGTFLYPPQVQHKGNVLELTDGENIEMPKECAIYNDQQKGTSDWIAESGFNF